MSEGLLAPDYIVYGYEKAENWSLVPVGSWRFYGDNQSTEIVSMDPDFSEYELVLDTKFPFDIIFEK